MPCREVIARLRSQLHVENTLSILLVENYPHEIHTPERRTTSDQLIYPTNSVLVFPSPWPHVLVCWQPAVSPNINVVSVSDPLDKVRPLSAVPVHVLYHAKGRDILAKNGI
jgi:hypothetical protein